MTSPPAVLKPIFGFLKTATDHENIDPIISYWCRLHAVECGIKIDASKESTAFLGTIIQWLEKEKTIRKNEEAITNEIVGQAYLENYASKLFSKAEVEDQNGKANKNTARLYFTAAQIFDLTIVFGELSLDAQQKSKYAKWRAAYIVKCIKNGEQPQPPEKETTEEDELARLMSGSSANISSEGSTSTYYPSADETTASHSNNQPAEYQPSDEKRQEFNQPLVQVETEPRKQIPSITSVTSLPPNTALNGEPLDGYMLIKAREHLAIASHKAKNDDILGSIQYMEKALSIFKTGRE